MTTTAAPASIAQRAGFFLLALLALSSLSAALIRLDFETGSPIALVVPVIPMVFILNYWLPQRFSHHILVAGSIAASWKFMGPYNTVGLVMILSVFAGIFSVFKTTRMRIMATGVLLALLGFLRAGFVQLPVIPIGIPVAASMIMFRFIIMLYEHHYKTTESTFIQKLSYLFILPALAFPLYPIVDYKGFLRNQRPADHRVIRVGLTRIAVGILFMLLHRVLYLYVFPAYVEIHNALTAGAYMIGSYLYVIHILGIFWCGIGFLSVLGFDLPPVFNNMFLIDSFRDIWKRINTYWRDFVVKLIYYPLYFRLRKNTRQAILITSLITLTASALLHGWQWFWLQGTFTLQITGIIFWTIIGLVISINLSMQPKNESGLPVAGVPDRLWIRAMRITGMFLFMSLMWSIWNSAGLEEWTYMMHFYSEGNAVQWVIILVAVLLHSVLIFCVLKFYRRDPGFHILSVPMNIPVLCCVGIVLLLPTFDRFLEKLPDGIRPHVAAISTMSLTSADQATATENYYNRMLASDGTGMKPWEMHMPGSEARSGLDEACERRSDILVRELIPNKVTLLDGWSITTNQFGMRDREYTQDKPAGVYRIAVLGASYEMGSGVVQDSVFEALTEVMLNDSLRGCEVQILNFSVGGYHLPQQVWIAQNKIAAFEPDLVLVFVHPSDATRNSNYMSTLIRNGTDLVYPELYAIKKESGAEQLMGENELKNRLYPYSERIAEWSLAEIHETTINMHAYFGVVYIPSLLGTDDAEYYRNFFGSGKGKTWNNTLFIDLATIFEGNESRFKLQNDPTHPNGLGHLAIAANLTRELVPFIRNAGVCTP